MQRIEDFYSAAAPLIQAVDAFARKHALEGTAIADHICFKCGSNEEFERIRALLEPESVFMYQSYISGRRIALPKLKKSLVTLLGSISIVELSDQKPDHSQTSRFDHIEIYPVGIAYEELAKRLTEGGVHLEKVERPHHTTYDIDLGGQFELKLTREPLVEKVKRDEML